MRCLSLLCCCGYSYNVRSSLKFRFELRHACRLQRFVDRVQAAVSCHNWHNTQTPLSVSTTLAAFAAALADQMRPIWAELVHLEENLHPEKANMRSQPQLPVTLLGLEYQLQVGGRTYCTFLSGSSKCDSMTVGPVRTTSQLHTEPLLPTESVMAGHCMQTR